LKDTTNTLELKKKNIVQQTSQITQLIRS